MDASVIKALLNSKCSEQPTDLIAERLLDFANLPFKRKKNSLSQSTISINLKKLNGTN